MVQIDSVIYIIFFFRLHYYEFLIPLDFPGSSNSKESAYNSKEPAGDSGSIPGSARSPGEGNGSPL